MVSQNSRFVMILGLILAVVLTAYAADSRTRLKPGWNLFSPQQDVEIGRESAKQAEMQLPILNDRRPPAISARLENNWPPTRLVKSTRINSRS